MGSTRTWIKILSTAVLTMLLVGAAIYVAIGQTTGEDLFEHFDSSTPPDPRAYLIAITADDLPGYVLEQTCSYPVPLSSLPGGPIVEVYPALSTTWVAPDSDGYRVQIVYATPGDRFKMAQCVSFFRRQVQPGLNISPQPIGEGSLTNSRNVLFALGTAAVKLGCDDPALVESLARRIETRARSQGYAPGPSLQLDLSVTEKHARPRRGQPARVIARVNDPDVLPVTFSIFIYRHGGPGTEKVWDDIVTCPSLESELSWDGTDLSGSQALNGSYDFVVRATDSIGRTSEASVLVVVNE